MPAPTNPKKRALMPSGGLRKALRAAGHHLSPVVQVGKEGVTDALLRALDEQLAAHELVKVKVGTESPEDRFEAAERLGAAAGARVAQVLGRTVLVYRRHPEKPRFEPGEAPPRRAAAEGAAAGRRARPAARGRGRAGRGGGRGAGAGKGGGRGAPAGKGGGRGAPAGKGGGRGAPAGKRAPRGKPRR